MKKYILTLSATLMIAVLCAQSNISNSINIHIEKHRKLPLLSYVNDPKPSSQEFKANDNYTISFVVKNDGLGEATNCEIEVIMEGCSDGIHANSIPMAVIQPHEEKLMEIPISTTRFTKNGEVVFKIQIKEPEGDMTPAKYVKVKTKAFDSPYMRVESKAYGELRKAERFKYRILIQNTGVGVAEDVTLTVSLPKDLISLKDERIVKTYDIFKPGQKDTIDIELISRNNIDDVVFVKNEVKERYNQYSAPPENRKLVFGALIEDKKPEISHYPHSNGVVVEEGVSLYNDVDEDDKIPKANWKNKTTFVLIIANENYQHCVNVDFAKNDGNIFKKYCNWTLGIPSENIRYIENATSINIKDEVEIIKNKANLNSENRIIFYYSGHGFPDVDTKSAYLLPVDGNENNINTGYKIDDLFAGLKTDIGNQTLVLLDACFSGLYTGARGPQISTNKGKPTGNMVVFAAAQGTERAFRKENAEHGLFTYHILKHLQDSKGRTTLKELTDYVIKNVKAESSGNFKQQTPCVTSSPDAANQWGAWNLMGK